MTNIFLILITCFLAACSGGGGGSAAPVPTATPSVCGDSNASNVGSPGACVCNSGYTVNTAGTACTVSTGGTGITYSYSSSYSSYAPLQSATTPCQGTVATSRIMTCTRSPDNVVVSNTLCTADPFPNSFVQSKSGTTSVSPTNTSLTNGVENMTCSTGATSGTRVVSCNTSYHVEGASLATQNCFSNAKSCTITNGSGTQTWNGSSYGACTVSSCDATYHIDTNACTTNTITCPSLPANAATGTETWNGSSYGSCVVGSCNSGYTLTSGSCVSIASSGASLLFKNKMALQILSDGTLKGWGLNEQGQLAVASQANQSSAVTISLGTSRTAAKVYSNGLSTCSILDNGTVKCWGYNANSQLGDGSTTLRTSPVVADIGSGNIAKELVLGSNSYCALLTDGTVKCWGKNGYGELGVGNATDVSAPTLINFGTGRTVKKIVLQSSASSNSSCAILDDDTLRCWGGNAYGQLGDGTSGTNRTTPVAINLGTGRTAKNVYMFANVNDDSISTCAILDNDSLKCWGYNGYGKLGVGDTTNKTSPTAVSLGVGRTVKALYNNPKYAMCAILDNDSLSCWGRNDFYQVGNGSNTDQSSPVSVIASASSIKDLYINDSSAICALTSTNSLICWGDNFRGSLGLATTNLTVASPTAVNLGARTVKKFSSTSPYNTCLILDDDSVQCAGDNIYGTVGVGTATANYTSFVSVSLGSGKTAKEISLDNYGVCVILNDNTASCWGSNEKNKLGTGASTSTYNSPQAVSY
jgi:alpha-tubulin suppressor-like RCC1 family protein